MNRKSAGNIIWVIAAAGLFLRLWGIKFGLPHLYHADEPIVVNHALAYGSGDLNPHFFKIPPLTSYILFALYGFYFLAGKLLGLFGSVRDFEFLFYADPSSFYLLGRVILGALCGTAVIYVLFRLVRRHFGDLHAVLSAGLLAVCFLHVRDSHYIYPDLPLNLVMVSAFIIFLRLADKPSLKYHLCSGILIGLATAFKYNGAALAVPYLAAMILNPKARSAASSALACALSLAVFTALNPFWLLDWQTFFAEIRAQSSAQTGAAFMHHFNYSLSGAMGWPLALLGLGGMVYAALDKKNPKKLVLLSFQAAYYLILWKSAQHYDRYVLPLVALWLFFAADLMIELNRRFAKGRRRALFILAILCAAPSFARAVLWNSLMSRPDTRTLAKEWIEKEIPPGSSIAVDWDFYMPRLSFSPEQLAEKKANTDGHFSAARARRLDYLLSRPAAAYRLQFLNTEPESVKFIFATPAVSYDLSALKTAGVEYILRAGVPRPALDESFWKDVEKNSRVVKEWSPYRGSAFRVPYDAQPLTGGPFTWEELENRERNGMPIILYKLQS